MLHQRIATWLEIHWVAPAYSGWIMIGLAVFFFAAATNTMAGWLYVISGVMLAILTIAAVLPTKMLQGIQISRSSIPPISVGDFLSLELILHNQTRQPKTLLQVQDKLPSSLSQPNSTAIEIIPARETYCWLCQQPTDRRGVYRWHTVSLRTAAPLGLFWCQRRHSVKATAVVYPTVVPLAQCPLVDEIGKSINQQTSNPYHAQTATEGMTRTVRPYRWGDSTRLVHWRTSARYGELRVRELETYVGGQELVICLDSSSSRSRGSVSAWQPEQFEQAVVAAASVYFYALHHKLRVSLWTSATGIIRGGDRVVLETLAAIHPQEAVQTNALPGLPVLWLSWNPDSLGALPAGSRYLLWLHSANQNNQDESVTATSVNSSYPGRIIQPDQQSLQLQLQAPLSRG
jgi:uncharacterized protein (DUF58 family)